MRGEYIVLSSRSLLFKELPPHARRILPLTAQDQNNLGTTSACAENTPPLHHDVTFHRNYLRMRGEYITMTCCNDWIAELPPHARRILGQVISDRGWQGTTSACAENTRDLAPTWW